MSRVPLIVPLWVLGSILIAIFAMAEPHVLVVAFGAILIAGGVLIRLLHRRHDRDHHTN